MVSGFGRSCWRAVTCFVSVTMIKPVPSKQVNVLVCFKHLSTPVV